MKRLTSQPDNAPFEVNKPRSARENGYFGKQVIFELKLLRDKGCNPDHLREHFTRFQSFRPKMSTQEQQVEIEGQGIIARALKNLGKFEESAEIYQKTFKVLPPKANLSHTVLASWAKVRCKLGEINQASKSLDNKISFFRDATGGQLLLARAHAGLIKGLFYF